MYLGDFAEDATLYFFWNTYGTTGASITRSTDGTVKVYKDNATGTESVVGVTDGEDHDGQTGVHLCTINLAADAFYATGSDYHVMVDGMVVDGRTVNARIAEFSIENRFAEVDLTKVAGQTVVSDAGRVATTDELYRGTVASAIGNTDFVISGTPITFSNQYLGMYATFYDDGDDGKTNSTVLIDLTETNDFLGTLAPGFTVAAGDVVVISKTMPGQALTGADGDTLEDLSDEIAAVKAQTAAIETDTQAIETDTGEIGTAGAGLTDVGGMSTTMKGQVQTEVEEGMAAYGAWSAGTGEFTVNHDKPTENDLAYLDSGASGIDNAMVRVFLTTDYAANSRADSDAQGITTTDSDGGWVKDIKLDAEDYTVEFYKQGYYGPDVETFTVGATGTVTIT